MKTITLNTLQLYFSLALFVFLACLGLGLMDNETKGFSDLFLLENIFGMLLYFIPAFWFSLVFYKRFLKRHSSVKSLVYGVLVGIPIGFIIALLLFSGLAYLDRPTE